MEEPINEFALQIIDTGKKYRDEYAYCDNDNDSHFVLSTYNPYDNKFSIVLYDRQQVWVVHSEVTPLKLNYLKPFLQNVTDNYNDREVYGTSNAEDGQHIVDIERKLGEGVYIGTQTMRRCIISIAQGIDGNIYLATYQNREGRMEYYHYNMNDAGLATEFELHSSIQEDLYTRWPLYYNGLMYFKIICSSDGTKLVVFREKESHYFVSVFSTDNFQPICEVRMFEERIKTWRTNKGATIRDVKFACNDSYLLMLDSDSVLYSVNISTATWDRIIHGTQYNIAEGRLYYVNNKINDKFDIAYLKYNASIQVHCTNNDDNICYYILTINSGSYASMETFVVELYYDGNTLHNVSRIFTYSMDDYIIKSACMSLNNEIYFFCKKDGQEDHVIRRVDHEVNKNRIKNNETGLSEMGLGESRLFLQNTIDDFKDYSSYRLMHEPRDKHIPVNYINIKLKHTLTGYESWFLQFMHRTNLYDMHHKIVIETDALGYENEEQYIIINARHTIRDSFNQPRLLIFKLNDNLKPSSVMNWYDPEAAGFAPVNRNTNRLGDPFVRGQFEQQMKERSNYTKNKLLESGRAPRTVFDQAAELGMVKSNVHNLRPDIERSGDKVYNDMTGYMNEWKSNPRQLITSDSVSTARSKQLPSSGAIDLSIKPKTMATKSQSDLSLRYPYSKSIKSLTPKQYDTESLDKKIKSTRDPQVLENIKKYSEEDRKYRRDESIRKSLNPALGYTNTTAINTVNSRVERLEEKITEVEQDVRDVKKDTSNILDLLERKLKGGKKKTRKRRKIKKSKRNKVVKRKSKKK